MNARITTSDNFTTVTVNVPWDGTEEGKIKSRKLAYKEARKLVPNFQPAFIPAYGEEWEQ